MPKAKDGASEGPPQRKSPKRNAATDSFQLRLPDNSRAEGGYAKSIQTRLRILEAAIDCLAVKGYAGTTVSAVAERADLTRPAMQYHFASRSLLIEGVIHHIMRVRLQNWLDDIPKVKNGEIYETNLAWEHTQKAVFRAFSELLVASRTDAELSSVFSPALAEYDRVRRMLGESIADKAALGAPWFHLRRDIVRFLVEGLAIQKGGLSFDADRRINEILAFLRVLFQTKAGHALMGLALEHARKPTSQLLD